MHALIQFVSTEFDEDTSAFRAEAMVDFMLRQIGPSQYNPAIADARKYMAEKIEDMGAGAYMLKYLKKNLLFWIGMVAGATLLRRFRSYPHDTGQTYENR